MHKLQAVGSNYNFLFPAHCVRKKQLRSSRKHISIDDRHSLAVYTNHNMDEESDIYNDNDSEEEIFKPR